MVLVIVAMAAVMTTVAAACASNKTGVAESSGADGTATADTDQEPADEGSGQADPSSTATPDASASSIVVEGPVNARGTVIVTLEEEVQLLQADGSQDPLSLSGELDAVSPGHDGWVTVSRNGQWLLLDTERFGCQDWACLVLVRSDVSEATVVEVSGELVHSEDWGAVSDDGSVIVITTANDGPNGIDLVLLRRNGDDWSQPETLTASSPHRYNARGRFTADESAVVFDCGPTQYSGEGTGICRVGLDGTGFERLVAPEDGNGASASNAARGADVTADGGLVFEADWGGTDRLWRINPDGTTTLQSGLANNNMPCVLPDGSIASVWLGREGNSEGLRELTIQAADDSAYQVLLPNADVVDLQCGA